MTVTIKIGRRVPRKYFRRLSMKARGMMTFQENMWLIIQRSMSIAKRKATKAKTLECFTKKTYQEPEDLHYNIEWIEINIKGRPDQEEEEYQEAMQMYKDFDKIFKEDLETPEDMKKAFNTKVLSEKQLKEVYSEGYGAVKNKSISQKLLDLGIITHIEKT